MAAFTMEKPGPYESARSLSPSREVLKGRDRKGAFMALRAWASLARPDGRQPGRSRKPEPSANA
jgi:hypothetical protein